MNINTPRGPARGVAKMINCPEDKQGRIIIRPYSVC